MLASKIDMNKFVFRMFCASVSPFNHRRPATNACLFRLDAICTYIILQQTLTLIYIFLSVINEFHLKLIKFTAVILSQNLSWSAVEYNSYTISRILNDLPADSKSENAVWKYLRKACEKKMSGYPTSLKSDRILLEKERNWMEVK